tara:strand:- start:56 stop:580 length:525 start_codon:yes stop_codon:yes gene_type:complete
MDELWKNTAYLAIKLVHLPVAPLRTLRPACREGYQRPEGMGRDQHRERVSQLERYRILMKHYVQHNCSITISFDESEIEEMADWFMENWDSYVGVSFLKRNDPTMTAKDLGFAYLPQEAISDRVYEEYVSKLLPLDLTGPTCMSSKKIVWPVSGTWTVIGTRNGTFCRKASRLA